jgi:hypothetical protein
VKVVAKTRATNNATALNKPLIKNLRVKLSLVNRRASLFPTRSCAVRLNFTFIGAAFELDLAAFGLLLLG